MLEVGREAPQFRLEDHEGSTHDLADYRGRWVVLYSYPKDDTPGCTAQACSFRDNLARIAAHDAVVLGISADDAASHAAFVQKHELGFPLLVDPDRATLEAYGVWVEKRSYGREYMGVARTTYLIDPEGTIAAVWRDVEVEGHADEVIAALERLRGTPRTEG